MLSPILEVNLICIGHARQLRSFTYYQDTTMKNFVYNNNDPTSQKVIQAQIRVIKEQNL